MTKIVNWPESTTPVAMTLDESDAMRLGEDVDPMAFVEAWVLDGMPELDDETQRAIDDQVERYADEYENLDDELDDVWEAAEIQDHLYRQACEELIKLSKPELESTTGVCPHTSEWADEDEKALCDLHSLWAYEFDDDDADEMLGDEWTEWLVLAGELERVDSGDEQTTPVWAWCPDWRAELPGSDCPFSHLDDAKAVFDAYDPMGLWFSKRHVEAMTGEEPQLWRRYEVDLVCQTCTRDAAGLVSVRDDAVRLSKAFDVEGDKAAQALIASILSHI